MLLQRGQPVKAQFLKLMGFGDSNLDMLYVDHLVCTYLSTTDKENVSFKSFKKLCKESINEHTCSAGEEMTRQQKDSPTWHPLRFGRRTASRLHEVAHCRTPEGSLVESILCATKFKGTQATKRGNALEGEVLAKVAAHLGEQCRVVHQEGVGHL